MMLLRDHSPTNMKVDGATLNPFFIGSDASLKQEIRKWLVAHPGRAVTIYQMVQLFTAAFIRAAVMQAAIPGFKKTGIYPPNRDLLQAPKDLETKPSTFSCGSLFSISLRMLMPPPQEQQRVRTKNNRRKGKTAILTSSPYKLELEKKTGKTRKAPKRRLFNPTQNKKKVQKRRKERRRKQQIKP
ncbi:hypothetical protein ILUMI_20045 [Ignelater luminosus]|uniref:Uncharacterized protein n=1 Tax=Ignelater luminosus TaxID=2038154 RepID=A0A8K0G4Z9_IGNLU|nr:hypothetical protein ILUMI_20045 [Ignelater luminosus]